MGPVSERGAGEIAGARHLARRAGVGPKEEEAVGNGGDVDLGHLGGEIAGGGQGEAQAGDQAEIINLGHTSPGGAPSSPRAPRREIRRCPPSEGAHAGLR